MSHCWIWTSAAAVAVAVAAVTVSSPVCVMSLRWISALPAVVSSRKCDSIYVTGDINIGSSALI